MSHKIKYGTGQSHPARGAWIEILKDTAYGSGWDSRTPHGVRGLKLRHVRNGR